MTASSAKPPELPFFVAKPFSLLPKRIVRLPIERALNLMFATELKDGELDFLGGQVVTVNIDDMELRFSLTLVENKLQVLRAPRDGHLEISGTAYAFLQMAARIEDTDTLFFRRHLRASGDTELGLYVKNLLDSMDLDTMPLQPAMSNCFRLSLWSADATVALRSRVSRLFTRRAA